VTGRPKFKIDLKLVENYARLGASNREIADMLGCAEATIRANCGAVLAKARAVRRTAIRKFQWDAAKALNPAMLIWLGKNELGQVDKFEHVGAMKHEHTFSEKIITDPQTRELANALERRMAGHAGGNGVALN
jgi:hypothetical protein